MNKRVNTSCFYILLIAAPALCQAGPHAPAAGQPGSTAVGMNDPRLVAWATGWQDYSVGTGCIETWQTPAKALGNASGAIEDIVCLGNGGRITLSFDQPIIDGSDWDFAVFENGITDDFLELAYVEVSSNGIDFFRFPNDSLTADPVDGFGSIDPTNIDGFGGKYRREYGTPFDLGQLSDVSPLLDVNNVRFVRIVDIIGDGSYFDTSGDAIYDPHPTAGSGGFDLEAVGVMRVIPEPGGFVLCVSAAASLLICSRRRNRRGRN